VSATDDYVANNERHAAAFSPGAGLTARPRRRTAVVTCMDSRINLFAALGLETGDSHIIRNAGGVVTDDVIRSLVISQRMLGTREIVVILHTGCGMLGFRDEELSDEVERETGVRPHFAFEAFNDLDEAAHESVVRLRSSPLLRHRGAVRGFVYDVETGRLREVASG
jgi:carbonic anhydrase